VNFELLARNRSWAKRIGWAVAVWACVCGVGVLAGMSPRPLLLAGLCTALAVASWLTADSAPLAEATSWHVGEELISRPRGADARVATIERLMADTPSSAFLAGPSP